MSDDRLNVNATSRSVFGKGASRRLRRDNLVPAILYGADKEPQSIQIKHNEALKHLEHEAFYSQLLAVSVDGGEPVRSLLKDVQRHPYKQQILHMDFVRVVAGAELQVRVPLHFLNEDTCVGFKAGGVISHNSNDVLIACLPRNIPEYIGVDMEALEIGSSIHLADLKLPEGVRLVEFDAEDEDTNQQVAAVNHPIVESESDDEDDSSADADKDAGDEGEGGSGDSDDSE